MQCRDDIMNLAHGEIRGTRDVQRQSVMRRKADTAQGR
jgi:hypothetical protein